jgi:hypothetical protein
LSSAAFFAFVRDARLYESSPAAGKMVMNQRMGGGVEDRSGLFRRTPCISREWIYNKK